MRNIPVKVDGDTLEADEFNPSQSETEDLVLSSGQTLNPSDDFQVSKAAAIYAGSGDYYNDSGTADNYILSPLADKKSPPAYYDGLKIRFRPVTTNTGVSQIKLNGLSFVPLKRLANGVAVDLTGGELAATVLNEAIYNNSLSQFELTRESSAYNPFLIKISKKLDGLIMSNNGSTKIDISSGYFSDQGDTGIYHLTASLTKDINSTWVEGSGNGGSGEAILTANKFYYMFVIAKTDGTVDAGFDSSPTAVNLLSIATGYTKYRRIGGVYHRAVGGIKPFYETAGRTFHYRDAFSSAAAISTPQQALQMLTVETPPHFPVVATFLFGTNSVDDLPFFNYITFQVGTHDDLLLGADVSDALVTPFISPDKSTWAPPIALRYFLPGSTWKSIVVVKNGTIALQIIPTGGLTVNTTTVYFATESYQEVL